MEVDEVSISNIVLQFVIHTRAHGFEVSNTFLIAPVEVTPRCLIPSTYLKTLPDSPNKKNTMSETPKYSLYL